MPDSWLEPMDEEVRRKAIDHGGQSAGLQYQRLGQLGKRFGVDHQATTWRHKRANRCDIGWGGAEDHILGLRAEPRGNLSRAAVGRALSVPREDDDIDHRVWRGSRHELARKCLRIQT